MSCEGGKVVSYENWKGGKVVRWQVGKSGERGEVAGW